MTYPTMQQVLAELAAQRAEFAAFRARVESRERRRRSSRQRFLPAILLTLIAALAPLTLLAANPFTDLNPGSVHNPNIDAIYNAGVTTGCVPNAQYCPNDLVTREEMASFLARLGGLGANPPVANAKTLQGYAPSGLARVARVLVANDLLATPPQDPITVTAVYPSFQTVATVTLTAPAAGFVLVVGSTVGVTQTNKGVLLRLREAGGTTTSPIVGNYSTNYQQATSTPLFVFPVAAGERAFVLQAAKNTAGPAIDAALISTVLTALFIPFGPTGGSTIDFP